MNQNTNGRGRGRGRGQGLATGTSNMGFFPWTAGQTQNVTNRGAKLKKEVTRSSKENNEYCLKRDEEEWRLREMASEDRLEKARKIKKQAAEKFSHLLEDSDSSDEELRDEEIMRKALDVYKGQLENCGGFEPSNSMTNLLQSGETSCPVCIDPVKHADAVWNCIECFGIFHMQCIQRWARQKAGAQNIALGEAQIDDNILWPCPNCRHEYKQEEYPSKYLCFCGKQENPEFDPWSIPHSCGQECDKMLTPNCGHECLLLCHPGPCPPCPKTVKVRCYCGSNGPAFRRCSKKEWSCGSSCGKVLPCGLHVCQEPCHSGDCPACPEKSIQPCLCLKNKGVRDCADLIWQCSEVCRRVLSCNNHTCEYICHKGECGPCPRTGKRSCPCGKMSLELPCNMDIPTCEDTCGKLLECGSHYCYRQCHTGPCETCRQIVTKTCRCGKRSKEVPCCQVFTCDFKCTRTRNCQRHPCKKKCCDGKCPECEQICNRQLSCKNHKCPAQCHSGPCFVCPLKRDVKCFCGKNSLSVNCGAERTTKPPKCKELCKIPPSCHHEKRKPHHCHFNRCRDCKQTCNLPLKPCKHICPALCHAEVPVKMPKKPQFTEKKLNDDFQYVALPCPPCKVLLQRACYGEHEVSSFPCSEHKPYSCKRKCLRMLSCGNHHCERECHVVIDAPSEKEAGRDCISCEEPCLKPRPRGCIHSCKRSCHPGDCLPCLKFVRVNCHCGLIMMEIKCFLLSSGTDEVKAAKSCKNQCPKLLQCGHRCSEVCHDGKCPEPVNCNQKVKVYCPCKRRKKDQRCFQKALGEDLFECDEKCKEIKEMKAKEEEERQAAIKAEELKKQQDELEWFKRKTQGRKRKPRQVVIAEEDSFFKKYKIWIILSISIAFLSMLLFFLVSKGNVS